MTRPQFSSLAAGVAITLIGVVLLLQEEGTIDLTGGWLLAALAGLAGAALVASGMGARDP
jgi:hypothetical protein